MKEERSYYPYSPVIDYNYSQWFKEVQYNGKELSDSERKEFVAHMDGCISQYSEALPVMHGMLEDIKDRNDEFHVIQHAIISSLFFVHITMIDSMVASKIFIQVDQDYDRRFMRGKLFVILNEGFKKLYGFDSKTHKKSVWDKLLPLMKPFPESINHQYQELTFLLEKQAKSSSWWKDERNRETHLDAESLYNSRQEEVIESKVIIDTMKLFEALLAVSNFLSNTHACLVNYLIIDHNKSNFT